MKTAVGIPVFNEEANLADLLSRLVAERGIDEIIAVDDCSEDSSLDILRLYERDYEHVKAYLSAERSGQLAAWQKAADRSCADLICFIDADAIPAPGAIRLLFEAIERDDRVAIVSGQTLPDESSRNWAPARFRAKLVHALRSLQHPRHAIIGRFFAVRREWFLSTATRSDIIANDSFLSGAAQRAGLRTRYVPAALCYYAEAQTTFDFAAQRQRADAGYAQLRSLNIILKVDEPTFADYVRVFARAAASDPIGARDWVGEQLKARRVRAYNRSGRDAGSWDVQVSTKRKLDFPPPEAR